MVFVYVENALERKQPLLVFISMGEIMDTLANALITIKNAEMAGKKECTIQPASKLIGEILRIFQKEGFIGNFEFIDDGKAGKYRVDLLGRINNCRAIKPRYSVKKDEILKWEKRYLPALGVGLLILSTPQGILSNKGAKAANTGGRLLAYIY